jgi:hypothetical protein
MMNKYKRSCHIIGDKGADCHTSMVWVIASLRDDDTLFLDNAAITTALLDSYKVNEGVYFIGSLTSAG